MYDQIAYSNVVTWIYRIQGRELCERHLTNILNSLHPLLIVQSCQDHCLVSINQMQ